MTLWYVTTGISLWNSSTCWRLEGSQDGKSWAARRDELKKRLASTADCRQEELQRAADQLVAENFRSECWDGKDAGHVRALSAELSTLLLLWGQPGGVQSGDEIRIIQGYSTPEVAAVLKAILERVMRDAPAVRCAVTLTPKCYRLDPKESASFNRAIHDLWNGEIQERDPAGTARFVMTGGYKAVLMALAVRMGRRGRGRIYYSHEGEPRVIPRVIMLSMTDEGLLEVDATGTSF